MTLEDELRSEEASERLAEVVAAHLERRYGSTGLAVIQARVDGLEDDIKEHKTETRETIEGLRSHVDTKVEYVDGKFETLRGKMDTIELMIVGAGVGNAIFLGVLNVLEGV